MKLGITGSRSITGFDFLPYFLLRDRAFRSFCRRHSVGPLKITEVISGGAAGIDALAFRQAREAGLRNIQCLPDREMFPGRRIFRAYRERNERIIRKCDILLAVWDGVSRGTKDTLDRACAVGRPAFIVFPESPRAE